MKLDDLVTNSQTAGRSFCFTMYSLNVHSWIPHELQVGTSLGRRHNLVRFQI